jgi:hypothetical protein
LKARQILPAFDWQRPAFKGETGETDEDQNVKRTLSVIMSDRFDSQKHPPEDTGTGRSRKHMGWSPDGAELCAKGCVF